MSSVISQIVTCAGTKRPFETNLGPEGGFNKRMRLLTVAQRFTVALNEIRVSGKRGRSVTETVSSKKYRCDPEQAAAELPVIDETIMLVVKEVPKKRRSAPVIGLSPEYWSQYMCGPDPRIWAAEDIQRAWRRTRQRRLLNSVEYLNFDGLKLT
jgi:hypothetical protein